jgi:hypothetical protein
MIKVIVYLKHNAVYKFPARNVLHAREIAHRIVTGKLWITEEEGAEEGTELMFPTTEIFKVKIKKEG